jgi:hypothetical protein
MFRFHRDRFYFRICLFLVFLGSVIISNFGHSARKPALKGMAVVGGTMITDRDIDANALVDQVLFKKSDKLVFPIPENDLFVALNRLVVEYAVSREAEGFGVAKVSVEDISRETTLCRARLQSPELKGHWMKLGITDEALRSLIARKLRANRFIEYKSKSSMVQVTDEEAEEHFKKNKAKFGSMSFDAFKEDIKSHLGKKNADERLRAWFDILKEKYHVRVLWKAGSPMTGS